MGKGAERPSSSSSWNLTSRRGTLARRTLTLHLHLTAFGETQVQGEDPLERGCLVGKELRDAGRGSGWSHVSPKTSTFPTEA